MPINAIDKKEILSSMEKACGWLADTAQIKNETLPPDVVNDRPYIYNSWKGAIKTQYSAADRKWTFMCPVWHSGQAVKALMKAYKITGNENLLESAKLAADFIFNSQVWDEKNPDHGLILAFEDFPDKINASAIIECLEGLMIMADFEKSEDKWQRIIAAAEFLIEKMYIQGMGVFMDVYDPAIHSCLKNTPFKVKGNAGGRPLLDDAVFLKLYNKTGKTVFLEAHMQTAERLVRDQNPQGNWIDYGPCNVEGGSFHPRHTYWWGMPLLFTYNHAKDKKFLDAAISSAEFAEKSMREDGGWFRGYYLNGKTDSFGHATSGSACSAIFWMELYKVTGEKRWLLSAEKALSFCIKVQFTNPSDTNLKGAILEKILSPDGTDKSPYYLRDLGTIFFIQAAAEYISLIF
ncbi:MAG: hypothetical protein A2017_13415 [Lentisphaerae bacterium GWF2_44_16]|nr:MAG: hypothetical protein A2017_13415 [Lentisphaerae bacterium GWF2_44_16]